MQVQPESTGGSAHSTAPEGECSPAPELSAAGAILGVQQLSLEENSVPGAGATIWYEMTLAEEREEAARAAETALPGTTAEDTPADPSAIKVQTSRATNEQVPPPPNFPFA